MYHRFSTSIVGSIILLVLCIGVMYGQVLQGQSGKLKFGPEVSNSKVFGLSKTLNFGAANDKITAVSKVLSFGQPKKQNENLTAVSETAQDHGKKNEPVVPDSNKEKEPEVRTAEESKTSIADVPKAQPGSELGEEYKTKLPDYYALIIGVSDYKFDGQGIQSLDNPTRDAEQLYNVLTKEYAFDPAKVNLLKNGTRQQIIDAFEALSNEIDGKDNLLVFYAGHGFYDKQKQFGFWLPSDARMSSRSDWIANSQIKDYLTAIKSKHTLLITDACFGGSIFKSRSVDDYNLMKIHQLYMSPSRKAITSGNLSEVPDQSIFLEQLLKKLSENQDDYLPAQKLFTRIFEPVSNNSSSTPQFGIIQGAGDEGGDFIFIKKKQ